MTDPSPLRALIVDDEPGIRRLLFRLFATRGWGVEVAEDGAEGLAALGRTHFDVVISDISMPRLDGVRLWDAVQELPRGGDPPPFVFVSAGPVPSNAPQSPRVRYVPKPFVVDDVWRAVQALLSPSPPPSA